MTQIEELGQRIKDARLSKKWSVVEAAKRSGIARDTWKKIESGESVQDTKRRAAMETVGLDEPRSGWVDVPPDDIDNRPVDPNDPVDAALIELQRAAADLVRAENELDAATRRWTTNYLLGEQVREELERRGYAIGAEVPDAEVESIREAIRRPTASEVAEQMAWGALHDPREWTRYEMALIEYVFDDYPGDVRRGSSYADLGPFRDRVERLKPVRARDVSPAQDPLSEDPVTLRPAANEDELEGSGEEGSS